MKRKTCPLCAHEERLFLFDRGRGGAFETVVCNGCGFVYVPERDVGSTANGRLDTGAYRQHRSEDLSARAIHAILSKEARAAANAKRRYDNIKEKNPEIWSRRSCEVYDIGASLGLFLQHWAADGYQVSGCEPDEYYAKIAQAHFGFDLKPQFYEDKDIKESHYYFISMNHVLGRVVDPRQIMKQIRIELSDDGYLYIEVPTIDMPYGGNLDRFFWIEHINYFSLPTLTALLRSEGFDIVRHGRIGYFLWVVACKAPTVQPLTPLPIERPDDVRQRTTLHYLRYVTNELRRLDTAVSAAPATHRPTAAPAPVVAKAAVRTLSPQQVIQREADALARVFETRAPDGRDPWGDDAQNIQHLVSALQKNGASTEKISQFGKLYKHVNSIRAITNRSPYWPTGVLRAQAIVRDTYAMFADHADLVGARYLDIGCGNTQPFCTSAVFFLNGAEAMAALDINDTADTRAAVSLYDVLADCALFPDQWHLSRIARSEFLDRIHRFDLRALREGRLRDGLRHVPLHHVVRDIGACNDMANSFDTASSRVVLEHFMEFDAANWRIFEMMRPGGTVAHYIDLSDHRKKRGMHAFSFLAEEDFAGDTNRLRSSEIRAAFDRIGFETLDYRTRREPMPSGFEAQMLPKYRAMDRADVEIVEVTCVLRRPAAAPRFVSPDPESHHRDPGEVVRH